MRMIRYAATALALGASASAAIAGAGAGFADLGAIDRAVERFTGASTGAQGGATLPVDRRLKLAPCPAQLSLEWYGRARDTVLVRCPQPGGWRLFVPVMAMQAGQAAQTAVARGEVVSIIVQGAGFTLTRQGEAMDGGAVGDWIRVRPVGAKADPLRLRIIEPGKVGMNLP